MPKSSNIEEITNSKKKIKNKNFSFTSNILNDFKNTLSSPTVSEVYKFHNFII